MSEQIEHPGAPSEEEISTALEAGGYPLELRVFEELREGGMDPVFGFRSKAEDDKPTKDIDVLARSEATIQRESGSARASLKAMIAVKKLPLGAFVGFTATAPTSLEEIRSIRARVGGLPSWRAIAETGPDAYGESFSGENGIACALDRLHAGPICIQWTVVKREQGKVRATQDQPVYEDVATTVKGSAIQARDVTLARLRGSKDTKPLPDLHFYFPTLVLDAPLRVYDPTTRTLAVVDSLALKLVMDTHLGPTPVIVDVVSSNALRPFIERYKAAAAAMRTKLEEAATALGVFGHQQHAEHAERERGRQRDIWAK